MDKAEHNEFLSELLEEIEQASGSKPNEVRLLLLASELDDIEVLRFIESLGCTIAIDEMCTGSRYFWGPSIQIQQGKDLIASIANFYVNRDSICPHKDIVVRYRIPQILKFIDDYKVQGVLYLMEKFCEPHGYDLPKLKSLFDEKGLPFLLLEVDLTTPMGQFRTRLEAFLDLVRDRALLS